MRPGPLFALLLALTMSALLTGPASAEPSEGYACSWHQVQVTDGLILPFERELLVERPYTRIRMLGGAFYRLEACGEPVGLVWQGEGELILDDPGVERSHLVHNLYANLPGSVDLEAAILFATDGSVQELLAGASEGAADPWQEGTVPPSAYGVVRSRTAPFQPATGRGARPPGEALWSPQPELGALWADLKVAGVKLARPTDTLTPPPRWLTVSWTPRDSLLGEENGRWGIRSAGASYGRPLASFPSAQVLADGAGPYATRTRARTFDLLEADVVARVGSTAAWDRDLDEVDLEATLKLRALDGAGPVIGLWLMEGRVRQLGEQWAEAKVRGVRVAGAPARFDRVAGRLFVHLESTPAPGTELDVVVHYGGNLLEPGDQSAVTPLAGNWYPRPALPDRHQLTVTAVVPRFWDVAVTGRRLEEYDDGKTRVITSRTSRDVETGALFIQDGEAKVHPAPEEGLPVVRVVRHPDTVPANARIGEQVHEHLRTLASLLGPFPYAELEIVERRGEAADTVPGVIVLSRFDSPPDGVITSAVGTRTLLETLAMQWLAADMGAVSHHDRWLTEGLVSLAECRALELAERPARCQALLKGKRDLWLRTLDAESEKWLIGPLWSGFYSGLVFGNERLRAPLVMHRLRLLLGDERTWELVGRVSRAYQGQRLSTTSFLVHAQAVAEADLRRFFYGWVYATPQEPTARVAWAPRQRADGGWAVELETSLDDGRDGDPLPMVSPLLLRIVCDGQDYFQRIVITEEVQRGSIEGLPAEPTKLKLDPGRTFPGQTSIERLE